MAQRLQKKAKKTKGFTPTMPMDLNQPGSTTPSAQTPYLPYMPVG